MRGRSEIEKDLLARTAERRAGQAEKAQVGAENQPAVPSGTTAMESLQRSAGNAAVSSLARRLSPAHDEAKERQADEVADRTMLRVDAAGERGVAGTYAMAPALKAVLAPYGVGLGKVELDTSANARHEADAMGASGFADGNRVVFGSGEPDLATREGAHLFAHEAAHAALHAPVSSPGGGRLVHARMRGVRQAAEQMGGGRTTRGWRKKLSLSTNWDQILNGLQAYEGLETALTSKGDPDGATLAKAKPRMLTALSRISSSLKSWRKANDEEGNREFAEQSRKGLVDDYATWIDKTRSDDRKKATRRQAVAMLEPRVQTEMADVASGNWSRTLGLSDSSLRSKGETDRGQMGEVTKVIHETEEGTFEGFFKPETGFLPGDKTTGRDIESGINVVDPNFGARALAMYRLDQLLGAGVTTRVEFAVQDGQFGVVSERAKGTKASQVQWTTGSTGGGFTSVDDGTLQRCLNKLQILDAIALQLDRHAGNYFVQTDQGGNVTGVTGIDLDMSFGHEVADPTNTPKSWEFYAWRGLPEAIDEEFGNRILAVSEDQVRGALTGLLSPAEVEATVNRFRVVQQTISRTKEAGLLRRQWGPQTVGTTAPQDLGSFVPSGQGSTTAETYTEVLRARGLVSTMERLISGGREHIARSLRGEVPRQTLQAYQVLLAGDPAQTFLTSRGTLYQAVAAAVASRALTAEQAEVAIERVIDDLLADQRLRTEIEVASQEERLNKEDFTASVKKTVNEAWAKVLAGYSPKQD